MANIQRKQFTFYESFYDCYLKIPKVSDRDKFVRAIVEYALYGKEPEKLPVSCSAAFSIVKPVLDNSRKKAENGLKGGSAVRKQTEANDKQTEANRKQTEANREQEQEQEKGKGEDKEKDKVKEQLEQTGSAEVLKELWIAYPAARRDSFADLCKTVSELSLTGNDILMAISNLSVWKKSIDWTKDNGQYIPGLTKWIQSGKWVSPPPPAQLTSNPFLAIAMEEGCYEQG